MTFTHEHADPRPELRHGVHFYDSEAEFAEVVEVYLAEGMENGEAAVVVATPAHRAAITRRLRADGIDIGAAGRAGRIVMADAGTTLRRVSAGGIPDPARLAATMGDLLDTGGRVRIFGEMVALLCESGRVADAIRLEEIWCEWLQASAAQLLCAYPTTAVDPVSAGRLRALHDAATGPIWTNHPSRRRAARPYAARTFAPEVAAIGQARLFVTQSLLALGSSEIADDVALAVTELAANAVLHARTTFLVELASLDDGVELSVRDLGTVVPTMGDGNSLEGGGRGLRIVAALATRWGVERDRHAKVVWAEFVTSSPR